MSCVNTGSSPSPELLLLAKDIKMLQATEGLQCDAVWIAGSQLIHQGADPLSRGAWPFSHVQADLRSTFDPYAAVDSVVPPDVLDALRQRLPSATLVSHPAEWLQDELESRFSLLAPAPTAVRSCLLHFFDAHRRRHTGVLLSPSLRTSFNTWMTSGKRLSKDIVLWSKGSTVVYFAASHFLTMSRRRTFFEEGAIAAPVVRLLMCGTMSMRTWFNSV